MNTPRLLFFTVLADAAVSGAIIIIDCIGFTVRDADYQCLWSAMDGVFILMFLLLLLVGWIGILRFWSPARYCYVGAWSLALIQFATAESYQAPGWLYALYNVVAIIGGFLLALIFGSDLRHRYAAPVNKILAATPAVSGH